MKCDRSFVLVHASFEFLHVHGTEGIKKLPNSSINVESIRIFGAGEADCSRGTAGKGARQGS